ncbi:HTH-type transcriptional regulator BhcR [Pararhodobacter aggregans]|uniref:IclR family transcriptional regulator n=1 Tax=Pararhodobacter aggregans TaxID=404875 RepID=A0A2T7UT83_9RHOB|nr:HTH-type transcriptional regulator BhcR [Pararhodobacter aggregans]PTX02744.1 IclR family transcriptional regulator [Pararhodobacter aggregans]PVE47975.1 IclR family transcriptional regulator [Pararhodobacter aggregans]
MTESRRGRPKAFHDKTEQNTIRALDRAMALLQALAGSDGMTLTELAQAEGESPATTYRVLTTLAQRQMVELDPRGQVWYVGAGTFRTGAAFLRRTNVVERARAPMQALMRATNETANLGIEQQGEVLFLTQVETHQAIRAFFSPGTRSALHASGIGKALMAWMPGLNPGPLTRFTEATITEPEALARNLALTRSRGWALDNQERTEGMRCVAAPIFNAHGEPVAGVSISGPVFRLPPDALPELGARVRAAAAEITRSIGGAVKS